MANVEVALANSWLQNADEDRPDGFVRFVQTGETINTYTYDDAGEILTTRAIPKYKKTVTLTESQQVQYDQQQSIAQAINRWSLAQVTILEEEQSQPFSTETLTARIPRPATPVLDLSVPSIEALAMDVLSDDLVAHVATTRDAINERLQIQIDIDRQARTSALAHMGLVPGMTAYDHDIDVFERSTVDQRTQAWLAAQQEQTRIVQMRALVAQHRNQAVEIDFNLETRRSDLIVQRLLQQYQVGVDACNYVNGLRQMELQELSAVRSQRIQELSALMHGTKMDVPQFSGYRSGTIDRTPVADSIYQSAAMDMQKWNVRVQQQQALMGGLLGMAGNIAGGMIGMSDARLKHSVESIGNWRGLGLYRWTYVWGERGAGVMAQDVVKVRPDAIVMVGPFMAVNYGALQ